jgi:hypothetical protein
VIGRVRRRIPEQVAHKSSARHRLVPTCELLARVCWRSGTAEPLRRNLSTQNCMTGVSDTWAGVEPVLVDILRWLVC